MVLKIPETIPRFPELQQLEGAFLSSAFDLHH